MNAHTSIGAEAPVTSPLAAFSFHLNDNGAYVSLSAESPEALLDRIAATSASLAAYAASRNTISSAPLSTADSVRGSEGQPARAKASKPAGPVASDGGAESGKAGKDAPEPEAEEAIAVADDTASGDEPVVYEDVRSRVLKLSATKGREAAEAVLKALGVAKAQELAEADWPKAIAALDEALGE